MSAPNVIPKEETGTYERWEPNRFDGPGRRGEVRLTTAEQVENIHHQARQEGFKAGMQEARQRAAADLARMASIAAAFTRETEALDQALAQQILDLAQEIARRMLHAALSVKPELVLPVIQEAMRRLPALGESRYLHLNPQDAALAREHLAEAIESAGWKIAEDASIARGGCRATTSHGEADATLDSRWQAIAASLGRQGNWLADDGDPA
jgi:flagellar assembly protein FliH